jgi:glucan phosphoethanolaminetransferase (alkaline phosphatase superfamily)
MKIGIFLFYFIIFVLFFVLSRKKGEPLNYKFILVIPAILAFFLFLFSVIKIYFIYKILLVLAALVLFILTYWHWGAGIRKWFG